MSILWAVLKFLAFYPAHLLHTVVALVVGALLHVGLGKLGKWLKSKVDEFYVRLGF